MNGGGGAAVEGVWWRTSGRALALAAGSAMIAVSICPAVAPEEERMSRYRVLAWRDIPTQVEASDGTGTVAKRPMPRWFMQEISRITMREGLAGTDDYLDEFAWSDFTERDGTADEVADAVLVDLAARWGRTPEGRRLLPDADAEGDDLG